MDAGGLRDSLFAVRVQLDDLQAEMEAGDRCAVRIQGDAAAIDERVETHLKHAARCCALWQCASELRASIAQQHTILRELRNTVNRMRAELQSRTHRHAHREAPSSTWSEPMSDRLLEIRVECYAGHRGEQTPRVILLGDRRVAVTEVVDQWLAPDHRYFKLRGDDGGLYIVRQDVESQAWELAMRR